MVTMYTALGSVRELIGSRVASVAQWQSTGTHPGGEVRFLSEAIDSTADVPERKVSVSAR